MATQCKGSWLAESGYTGLFTPSGSNSLRFGTNNTERMRIDSSGNVGIGTSNIYADLHLQGGQQDIILTNTNADGVAGATIGRFISQARGYGNNGAEHASIDFETNASAWFKGDIVFKTNNSDGTNPAVDAAERMRIDSSGNVGIGVVPEAWTYFSPIQAKRSSFAGSDGQTGVGYNWYFDGAYKYIANDYALAYQQNATSGVHSWSTAASGTADASISWSEAMRIDSSGNVLVGKTANDNTTVGGSIRAGESTFTAGNSRALTVGRNTNDGELIQFRKGTGSVGTIGTTNSFFVGTGRFGFRFLCY